MKSPEIHTSRTGHDPWIIRLTGEQDLSTRAQLQAALRQVDDLDIGVIVDLGSVTFVDSSILGELIRAHRQAEDDGQEGIALVAPPGSAAARLLDLVGAHNAIPIFETLERAIATHVPPVLADARPSRVSRTP
jgi:anti-anti-sigma factor